MIITRVGMFRCIWGFCSSGIERNADGDWGSAGGGETGMTGGAAFGGTGGSVGGTDDSVPDVEGCFEDDANGQSPIVEEGKTRKI